MAREADLQALAAQIAAWMGDNADAVIGELVERIRSDVPAFAPPELADAVRRAGAADVRAGLTGFVALDRRLPQTPPPEAGELARLAARERVPLTDLLRAYRVAQAAYWQLLFDAVHRLDAPPAAREQLLRATTTFLLDYVDQVSTLVTEEFTGERDRVLRRRELQRLGTIRDILAGTRADAGPLGYDLGGPHLGLVASGAQAEDAVRAIARDAGARVLLARPDDELLWAWLGDCTTLTTVHDGLTGRALPQGCRIGAGRPAAGLAGFRATHRQAQVAHRLGGRGAPVGRFHDVAFEALAAADEAGARRFVADELGPLAGDDTRARRLRETLLAYFAAGQNGAAAAKALHISPRTLSYRLRAADELAPAPIAVRSLELHAALRLQRHLSI